MIEVDARHPRLDVRHCPLGLHCAAAAAAAADSTRNRKRMMKDAQAAAAARSGESETSSERPKKLEDKNRFDLNLLLIFRNNVDV